MASKEIEDIHTTAINKILAESGIECIYSPQESAEEASFEEEEELNGTEGIEESKSVEEERVVDKAESKPIDVDLKELKEQPYAFPSPSLRKVLPDKIRKIDHFNQLHVLPENFNTKIDPSAIPKIATTPPKVYIDILAELIGCEKHQSSLAEYWVLDTLANLLRRGQEDHMDRNSQAVLMLWFCEWIKEVQYFDAADRTRMLKRFKDNMVLAAKHVAEECHLPTPADIDVYYKESPKGNKSSEKMESKHVVTFEGAIYECTLSDLTRIIHYIFDLTDYQFDLVRSVFCTTPQYTLIDAPYQIQLPKTMYVAPKEKTPKPKTPKKEKGTEKKGKKKEETNAEFIALMKLKEREELELLEKAEKEKDEWLRKSQILPLNLAATDDLFDKYWPPPTEAELQLLAPKTKPKLKRK